MSRIVEEMLNDCAEEVAAEVRRKIAISMLKDNHSAEMIAEHTVLSVKEVEKLKLEISGNK